MDFLSKEDRKILSALTDEYICASVIKIRAGYTSDMRSDLVTQACRKLERHGLAERIGSGARSTNRWRRVPS